VLTLNSPQITVSNSTQLKNIFIAQINGVLSPPKLASVLADPTVNLTSLAGIASIISLQQRDGTNATLAGTLGAYITKGYTLFALSNDALQVVE
jgi:hypothetical protein